MVVSLLPQLLPPAPARERVEVTPAWAFRLPLRNGPDGVLRRRGDVLERLLHVGEHAVLVRVAQPARERVVFGAWGADRVAAREALRRMRFALSVDDDLAPFHTRFADDPLIGRSLRARPWLRVARRPGAFEALAWAICEQLIEFPRAAAIERRIVWRLGRGCQHTGLRDLPTAERVAATAPAMLEGMDLAHRRALTLVRVARGISRGRTVLEDADQQSTLRRLRRVPGVGSWTLAMLSLAGLGRYDAVPAGDVNLLKRAGRLLAGGDPLLGGAGRDAPDDRTDAGPPRRSHRAISRAPARSLAGDPHGRAVRAAVDRPWLARTAAMGSSAYGLGIGW